MRVRSAGEIRLMAEQMLIRSASEWCTENRSRRLRERAAILAEAAAMADAREAGDTERRADSLVQASRLRAKPEGPKAEGREGEAPRGRQRRRA